MTLRSTTRSTIPDSIDLDQVPAPPQAPPTSGQLLSPATPDQLLQAADLILSHPQLLDQRALTTLLEELPQYCTDLPESHTGQLYGANFDLTEELNTQLRTVRAMRRYILTEDDSIRDNMTTKDVTELTRASTNLTNLLMKYHKEVINMDRMRAVEEAVMSVIMTWPDVAERERFISAMEKSLEGLE